MAVSRFATRLLDAYGKFRTTVWFRVTYLVLLGLIVGLLYVLTASAVACLVLFLMPLTVFVVPYVFGERKARHFAVNVLPVFVIAVLFAAALSTQALLAQDHAVPLDSFAVGGSNATIALSNGTVDPYRAVPGQNFTFRVKLTTNNTAAANFTVYLNLTTVRGLGDYDERPYPMSPEASNASSNNRKNGTWYAKTLPLADYIYGYAFSATDGRGNWTYAGPDIGPITASGTAFYSLFLYVTALSPGVLLPFTFYYVILFMWWYTVRMRATRLRDLGREAEIPEEEPKSKPESAEPAPPAKSTKAAAFTCTNCGADVGEDDEKCPKCGAVFEE